MALPVIRTASLGSRKQQNPPPSQKRAAGLLHVFTLALTRPPTSLQPCQQVAHTRKQCLSILIVVFDSFETTGSGATPSNTASSTTVRMGCVETGLRSAGIAGWRATSCHRSVLQLVMLISLSRIRPMPVSPTCQTRQTSSANTIFKQIRAQPLLRVSWANLGSSRGSGILARNFDWTGIISGIHD